MTMRKIKLSHQKKKKKPKIIRKTPFILSLCTPLMASVHETVCQAGEITFCDCTSSLDRFNTALSVLSTAHCTSGMLILSSDEHEETLSKGLHMLKSILPEKAFFGRGASAGPKVIMTDDSAAERAALRQVWPSTTLLLCYAFFTFFRGNRLGYRKERITYIRNIESC